MSGAVGAAGGVGTYGFAVERHRLEVTREDVLVPSLPPALDGLRIGLLTDPHVSRDVPTALVALAVDRLQAERPDLIVLGGDYVSWSNRRYLPTASELMARLRAPLGVFAALGNHDHERDTETAFTRAGLAVLRDARTSLTIRGEAVDLMGVSFWTQRPQDIAAVQRGGRGFGILLAHTPHRVEQAAALGIPLVLSGHTHGGQIVLPGLGPLAARRFPVAHGTYYEGQTALFVSRGVGTLYLPCRFNCPPEVAVLTLRTSAPDAVR